MIILPDGRPATPNEILLALVEEAKRRHTTYGTLRSQLSPFEQGDIVVDWVERNKKRPGNKEFCKGCKYWKSPSYTATRMDPVCNFMADTGRAKRKDESGKCLEKEEQDGYSGDAREDLPGADGAVPQEKRRLRGKLPQNIFGRRDGDAKN